LLFNKNFIVLFIIIFGTLSSQSACCWQGGMWSSLVARLCGETTAVHRTTVWYRAVVINLVCGLVSVLGLGVAFYGTVRLSTYLEALARSPPASSLMHALTGHARPVSIPDIFFSGGGRGVNFSQFSTHVGKPSATGQPTRPTQPFILSGSI